MKAYNDNQIERLSHGTESSCETQLGVSLFGRETIPKPTHRVLRVCLIAFLMFFAAVGLTIPDTPVDKVTALVEVGEYHEATAILEKLAKSTKNVENRSQIYHQLGMIYYNNVHDYPKALRAYEQIVRLRPKGLTSDNLSLAYIQKGDVHCRMGQYDEAIQSFQKLVDEFPATHFAHKTGLLRIRNIQTALENLREQERVINNHRETPLALDAQFQIAELYRSHYQLNQPKRAIREYNAIIETQPNSTIAPEAQWRIGQLQDRVLHQPQLAITAYQAVVDNYSSSQFAGDALFQIARLYERRGDYERTVSLFENLQQKHPDFWNVHAVFYWSGVCYEKLRDYRRAIDAFKTFLYVYLPELDKAYFGAIGKHDKTRLQIEAELKAKIQRLESDLPRVEWERIKQKISEHDYVTALPLAQQLIAEVPDSEYAKQVLGQFRVIEQYAAIQNLKTQIQKSSDASIVAHMQFQIGNIYERRLQDYARALASYHQLIAKYPESPWAAEALYRAGLIYANHLDDTEKAIADYKALITRYPNASQAVMANFQLGEVYHTLHRYDEAVEAYQTTISYPARDLYLDEGYKDSLADRAQFRIGRVHYEDRRYNDALITFEEFIKSRFQSPRLAVAYVYLALIQQELGNWQDASEAYENAKSLTIKSSIQAEMVIDEAYDLGFEGTDSMAVIQRLDELHRRVRSHQKNGKPGSE